MAAKKKYDADDDANEESALLGDASPIGSDDERTVVDSGASPGGHDSGAESDDDEGAEGRQGRARAREFPPAVDPRFVMPTPAPWKRAALLMLLVFCFWLAFQIKGHRAKPKVVHASRYSKEYKYRPAASPIVTETLKDGRLRVRGAAPTTSVTPKPRPTPTPASPSKKRAGKGGKGKGKKKGGKRKATTAKK
ncbi:hypothetical protein C8F04DRAFT_1133973 [Mycena alexandri]|uniref:Uncharacterized protein n=1 Tax=Mycena alexandri TaxID=1745969 RepID=A0AAD6WSQ1_9AGAR|nr:hypothetical protein C8F04DRAFT_1133973 [Mycena alexandri]